MAEAMVENMKKNMEDPDFFERKGRIQREALDKMLKKREERRRKLEEE